MQARNTATSNSWPSGVQAVKEVVKDQGQCWYCFCIILPPALCLSVPIALFEGQIKQDACWSEFSTSLGKYLTAAVQTEVSWLRLCCKAGLKWKHLTKGGQPRSRAKLKPVIPVSLAEPACVQPAWRPSVLTNNVPSCALSEEPAQGHAQSSIEMGANHHSQLEGPVTLSFHSLTHPATNTPRKHHAATSITLWLTGTPALLSLPTLPARFFIICSAACGVIILRKSPGGLHLQTPLLSLPVSTRT